MTSNRKPNVVILDSTITGKAIVRFIVIPHWIHVIQLTYLIDPTVICEKVDLLD